MSRDRRILNPLPVANLGLFPHTFVSNKNKGQLESLQLAIVAYVDNNISSDLVLSMMKPNGCSRLSLNCSSQDSLSFRFQIRGFNQFLCKIQIPSRQSYTCDVTIQWHTRSSANPKPQNRLCARSDDRQT